MKTRRIVFPGQNKAIIEEFELDETLRPNEVLIKNRHSLISTGTELSVFTGKHTGLPDPNNRWAKFPFYPGYASAGEITAVGNQVANFKIGDLVQYGGNHAAHHKMTVDGIIRCPTTVSTREAAYVRLITISLNGVRISNIALGESTVVIGQGLIGLFALCCAKLQGAYPLIAVDLSEKRLAYSKKYGADYCLNPSNENISKRITEINNGQRVRRVIEVTGSSKVIPEALTFLDNAGILTLLGGAHGKIEINFYTEIQSRGLRILGAHEARSSPYDFWSYRKNAELCLNLMASNVIDVKKLTTDEVDETEALALFSEASRNPEDHLGMIIKWS